MVGNFQEKFGQIFVSVIEEAKPNVDRVFINLMLKRINMLVTTVKDSINGYSTRQQKLAAVAMHIQRLLGDPQQNNQKCELPIRPITIRDIKNAKDFFGTNFLSLRGETTRHAAPQVTIWSTQQKDIY